MPTRSLTWRSDGGDLVTYYPVFRDGADVVGIVRRTCEHDADVLLTVTDIEVLDATSDATDGALREWALAYLSGDADRVESEYIDDYRLDIQDRRSGRSARIKLLVSGAYTNSR